MDEGLVTREAVVRTIKYLMQDFDRAAQLRANNLAMQIGMLLVEQKINIDEACFAALVILQSALDMADADLKKSVN